MQRMARSLLFFLYSILLLFSFTGYAAEVSQSPQCANLSGKKFIMAAFLYPQGRRLTRYQLKEYNNSFQHLDVIIYSLANISRRHKIKLTDYATYNLINLHRWLRKKHSKTIVLLSLAGMSTERAKQVFENESAQQVYFSSIIKLLKNDKYGLSGVDIDWENFYDPAPIGLQEFPQFVHNMRQAFNGGGLEKACVTLDLPVNPKFFAKFPAPKKWVEDVDWANLMGYEFYGESTSYAELDGTLGLVTVPYAGDKPTYPTASIATALSYFSRHGISKRKLIAGVPFYGTEVFVRDAGKEQQYGLRQPTIIKKSIKTIAYYNIYKSYGIYGDTRHKAQSHQYVFKKPAVVAGKHAFWMVVPLPWYVARGKGFRFISYEDPIAVREVARYVKDQGYLGMNNWDILYDLPYDDAHSLLRNIVEELGASE